MKGLITLCETVEDLRRALAACWGRGIQATVPSRGDQLEVLMERPLEPDAPTLRTCETRAQIVEAPGGEVAARLDDVDLVIGAAPPARSEGAARAPMCLDEVRVFDALVPTGPSVPAADPVTAERLAALICAEAPALQAWTARRLEAAE